MRKPRRPTYGIKTQSAVPSEDKAWLLGHLAGDGGVVNKPKKRYVSVYCGLDSEVAGLCVRMFKEVYDVPSTISTRKPSKGSDKRRDRKHISYQVDCYRCEVVRDLLSIGPFGIKDWRVPNVIANGDSVLKAAWISGFADAEGHMAYNPEVSRRTITLTSSNEIGLRQVGRLLSDLGIRHGISRPRPYVDKNGEQSESRFIYITYHEELERFSNLVGFRGSVKQGNLEEALSTYQRKPLRTEDVEKHASEIVARRRAGETHARIATSLGLVREVVAQVCYRHGAEPKGREGNAAGGTRSIGKSIRYVHEDKLDAVLKDKARGLSLTEIAERHGFRNQHRVQDLLQRAARAGKIERFSRGVKMKESLDVVISMRKEGRKLREIGRVLGREGTDQKVAIYVGGIIAWAKKKGFWEESL